MQVPDIEKQLADESAGYYDDPYGWVLWAFPWGEPGTALEHDEGPDEWQRDQLESFGREIRKRRFNGVDAVPPVRDATSSGHGIGKSAETSFLILFIMSTRPNCRGTVTANTSDQLSTKTWAELAKWHKLCITGHWFKYSNSHGNMALRATSNPENWFCKATTCREENSEAFAGQHAKSSSSFYIFDEASNVPAKIWEVAEGGLTDGEPFIFVFGNPTRNDGEFFQCFGAKKHRWNHRQIDSRECKFPNKVQIQEWQDDYGEDSDFFRVRVRGVFPRASDMQFIPTDKVYEAQNREARYIDDDPLILGVDVSRGGSDRTILQFRRGLDARSEKTYIIPGEDVHDSMRFVSKIVNLIHEHKPDAVFVDETGIGGPIIDRLSQLGYNVFGVHFGGSARKKAKYANRAAEMWGLMKDWLYAGGSIKDHPELNSDLTGRQFDHDKADRLILESKKDMKKRGLASPDWADALALTFAMPVAKLDLDPRTGKAIPRSDYGLSQTDYDPLDY